MGGSQKTILQEMMLDIHNIRQAWLHAAQHRNVTILDQSVDALYELFEAQKWFVDGAALIEEALSNGPYNSILDGKLNIRWAGFRILRRQFNNVQTPLNLAFQIAQEMSAPSEIALALYYQGMLHLFNQEYQRATECLEESIDIYTEINCKRNLALAKNYLGVVKRRTSEFDVAISLFKDALNTFKSLDDRLRVFMTLSNIGNVYVSSKQYEKASHYYDQSLALKQDIIGHSDWSSACILMNRGQIAIELEEFSEGVEVFRESYLIFSRYSDFFQARHALEKLCFVLIKLDEINQAIDTLVTLIDVLKKDNRHDLALALAVEITSHPKYKTREAARKRMASLFDDLSIIVTNNRKLVVDEFDSLLIPLGIGHDVK